MLKKSSDLPQNRQIRMHADQIKFPELSMSTDIFLGIPADNFTSLESISRTFRWIKYKKTSTKCKYAQIF